MIHELRVYQVGPGKMDQWIDFFRSKIIPTYERERASVPVGWRDDEQSQFVWVRAFRDKAHMERVHEAVVGSEAIRELRASDFGVKVLDTRLLTPVFGL